MNKQYPIRVAATADVAQEANSGQVPHIYRVHAMMPGADKTMCAQLASAEVIDIGMGQVVSCPDCRDGVTALAGNAKLRERMRADLDRADAELITAMQMRANTLRNVHVGRNESLAADLEIVAGRLAEHAASSVQGAKALASQPVSAMLAGANPHFKCAGQTPSHDTSVPQAPDDAVMHDKDCQVCGGSGTAFGKVCDCRTRQQLEFYATSLGIPHEHIERRELPRFIERRARPRVIEVDLNELQRALAEDARHRLEDIEQERIAGGDNEVDDTF